jgi:hypothetical protein
MRSNIARRRRRFLLAKAQGRLAINRPRSEHRAELAMQEARSRMPCAHKVRHNTFESAVANCVRRIEGGHVDALSPYRCKHCLGWHLTRQDQGKKMPRFAAAPSNEHEE